MVKPPREARVCSWPNLLVENTEDTMMNSAPAELLPLGLSRRARPELGLTGQLLGGVGGRETWVGAGEPLLHPDGSRELQRGSGCVTGETGPRWLTLFSTRSLLRAERAPHRLACPCDCPLRALASVRKPRLSSPGPKPRSASGLVSSTSPPRHRPLLVL